MNPQIGLKDARAIFLDASEAAGFDRHEINRLTTLALASDSSPASKRHSDPTELERRWYDSLAAGAPDYGVYDTLWYIAETFACWQVYSRKYIVNCIKAGVFDELGRVDRVIDIGCGIGMTTASFANCFPRADVVGINLRDTTQWKVAEQFSHRFSFTLSPDLPESRADVIFASEFFEHLTDPLAYLQQVLDRTSPRLFICANTFTAPAIGHFPLYRGVDGSYRDGSTTTRVFSQLLRSCGYRRVKEIKFWNDRPQVWRFDSAASGLF